ncbi:hypothetical protein SNEBB_006471 [Seison nebaliae]|nr:hypothetical protein SNEBB_006471 [Seison nebaliae]
MSRNLLKIPSLSFNGMKGECGKIAIIGGCDQYSGAPYFAGMAALRSGGDLVHIFCTESAAPIIKSYSPDLIVHGILHQEMNECLSYYRNICSRFSAIICGPGLGRNEKTLATALKLLFLKENDNIPMIIDADALYLLRTSDALKTINNRKTTTILTPNIVELCQLAELKIKKSVEQRQLALDLLTNLYDNIIFLNKGNPDMIRKGAVQWMGEIDNGCKRRCGGQGDILTGIVSGLISMKITGFHAAKLATQIMKLATKRICESHQRSFITSDIFPYLCEVIDSLEEEE